MIERTPTPLKRLRKDGQYHSVRFILPINEYINNKIYNQLMTNQGGRLSSFDWLAYIMISKVAIDEALSYWYPLLLAVTSCCGSRRRLLRSTVTRRSLHPSPIRSPFCISLLTADDGYQIWLVDCVVSSWSTGAVTHDNSFGRNVILLLKLLCWMPYSCYCCCLVALLACNFSGRWRTGAWALSVHRA